MKRSSNVTLIERLLLFIGVPVTKETIFRVRLLIVIAGIIFIFLSIIQSDSAGSRYGNIEDIRSSNPELNL